ncbi:MAG: hypothetical protein ACPKPY_05515 [Nitrososphaeraceae archaeon]
MTQKNNKRLDPYDKHVTINISLKLRNLMTIDSIVGPGKRSKYIEKIIENAISEKD